MTATETETFLDFQTIEEFDFTPACDLRREYWPGSPRLTPPCGKPATHLFTLHDLGCNTDEGYSCAEHMEELLKDTCRYCGTPRIINVHPIH